VYRYRRAGPLALPLTFSDAFYSLFSRFTLSDRLVSLLHCPLLPFSREGSFLIHTDPFYVSIPGQHTLYLPAPAPFLHPHLPPSDSQLTTDPMYHLSVCFAPRHHFYIWRLWPFSPCKLVQSFFLPGLGALRPARPSVFSKMLSRSSPPTKISHHTSLRAFSLDFCSASSLPRDVAGLPRRLLVVPYRFPYYVRIFSSISPPSSSGQSPRLPLADSPMISLI